MVAALAGGGLLSHGHLFGLKVDVKNNIYFAEEHLVVYPCGHNVVLLNLETRAQQLIVGTASAGITALALTSNRRLLAVAEAALNERECPAVNIYDASTLKRRKMLSWPEIGSTVIVRVAFSADGRLCLTQGGAPEWKLVLWTAEKASKVICSAKISSPGANGDPAPAVNQADFCPTDASFICVTGDKIVRFFRVADAQLKPLPLSLKIELQVYTAHCWLDNEQVVVATEQGGLYLVENLEFRSLMSSVPPGGSSIYVLAAFSKGFVTGGGNGMLRIYERSDDPEEFFKCLKTFHIEGNTSSITNLAVSPSEDSLGLTTSNSQIYSLALSSTEMLKEDTMNFERIAGPFPLPTVTGRETRRASVGAPKSRINGVSIAVWKPLVATVGMDKAFRLWNFQDKSSQLVRFFDETPLVVSLHPSGLYLLLSFGERVRLYSILMEDVRELKAFTAKHCYAGCFSGGGQYFAFASSAQVLVHETYTCVLVTALKGHQAKIRSIVWRERDRQILTTGNEGQVCVWETCTGRRLPNMYQAGSAILAASATRDFSVQFCVGEDMQIRELDLVQAASDTAVVRSVVASDFPLGALQVAEKVQMLFAGVASPGKPGAVRAYPIGQRATAGSGAVGAGVRVIAGGPAAVHEGELSEEFQEYGCLSQAVSCMALNQDGSLLFVGGEDGVLAMYCVADDTKAAEKKVRERDAVEYMEEVLVTRADVNARSKKVQGLKDAVEEMTVNNEYQLRLKDINYNEKIREVTDKFTLEVDKERRAYEELLDEKKDMELAYEDRIEQLQDQQAEERSALVTQHKNKISLETNRYQAMVQEKENLSKKWDEQYQNLVSAHSEAVQKIIEEYDEKVENEQSEQRKLNQQKEKMTAAFSNRKTLVEEDADAEAEFVKTKFVAKLAVEREVTLRLKGENGIMKKKFSQLSKQVEDQKEDMIILQERQRDLFETIKSLERDIQGHKKEIREREETIADKEKRIYDLKKKNQELEKFKFVLDYKIKELKRQIEPREVEISDMRHQIEEMDLELEQYHKSNSALDLMIGELRLKVDGMQRELDGQKERLQEGVRFNEEFHTDLRAAVQNMASDDNRVLKAAIVALYRLYNQNIPVPSVRKALGEDGDVQRVQREYNRQRDHMERNVEALKGKIEKDMRTFQRERSRLNRENVVLTTEINDLRRKAKSLSLQRIGVERAMTGDPDVNISTLLKKDISCFKSMAKATASEVRVHTGASASAGSSQKKDAPRRGRVITELKEGSQGTNPSSPAAANLILSAIEPPPPADGQRPIPPARAAHRLSATEAEANDKGRVFNADKESPLLDRKQQQMLKEVKMQEQQIRQLEHHAGKLREALEAGGLVSPSVIAAGGDAAAPGTIGEEEVDGTGREEADGDLP